MAATPSKTLLTLSQTLLTLLQKGLTSRGSSLGGPSLVFAGRAKRPLGLMLFLNRPQDILDTVFRNLTTEFGCLYIRGAIMNAAPDARVHHLVAHL